MAPQLSVASVFIKSDFGKVECSQMIASDAKRIGRIGESRIQELAHRAGFVVHQPKDDEHGWDHLLELQLIPEDRVSLDRRPPLLRASVQVKTSRAHDAFAIKLTVLENAAKDTHPWFFILVLLDKDDEPDELRVVHIDNVWVEKILQRLRMATSESKEEISEQTMRVSWQEASPLDASDCSAFRDFIVGRTGDPSAYARRKLDANESCGEPRWRAAITLGNGVSAERLAEAFVGRGASLPVSSMNYSEIRFGVELPVAMLEPPAAIEFKPRMKKGRLRVERDDGRCVDIGVEVVATPPSLPQELGRIRVTNGAIEITIRSSGEASVHISMPEEVRLLTLVETAEFWLLLRGGREFVFEFLFDVAEPYRFRTRMDAPACSANALESILRGGLALDAILRGAGHKLGDEILSLRELDRIAEHLMVLGDGVHGPASAVVSLLPKDAGRTKNAERKLIGDPHAWETASFLLNFQLPFVKFVVSLVLRIEGPAEVFEEGGRTKLRTDGSIRIARSRKLYRHKGMTAANALYIDEVAKALTVAARDTEAVVYAWKARGTRKPAPAKNGRKRA